NFFFFALEGVSLYVNLFVARQAAPKILCIKNWGHIGGEWTPFGNWQAHLGQVVRDSRRYPEYLIACKGDHDWPYKTFVQDFPDWPEHHPQMWARTKKAAMAWLRSERQHER
ncbi:MAG: hypothetical protein L0Z50_06280, partial [Verrucomicrobiales bacterium]|nr:hypothetical protein [Verrucomicrobiales bacterium]